MAERGRGEEQAENSWYQRSLGAIDIPEGSVRWVNILKKDRSKDSPPRWWVVMGIPDERPISNHKKFNIKTVRKKSFPIFGKVVDVNWKGKDCGTGLVKTLSTDESITDLAKSIGNLAIRARDQGWTLTVDRKFSPTNRSWESIQKIAEYVLSSPRSL